MNQLTKFFLASILSAFCPLVCLGQARTPESVSKDLAVHAKSIIRLAIETTKSATKAIENAKSESELLDGKSIGELALELKISWHIITEISDLQTIINNAKCAEDKEMVGECLMNRKRQAKLQLDAQFQELKSKLKNGNSYSQQILDKMALAESSLKKSIELIDDQHP